MNTNNKMASVVPFAFLLQYQQEKRNVKHFVSTNVRKEVTTDCRTYDRSYGSKNYPCITHSN